MLEETRYIAKKDFQDHLLEEKKIIEYFDVLQTWTVRYILQKKWNGNSCGGGDS